MGQGTQIRFWWDTRPKSFCPRLLVLNRYPFLRIWLQKVTEFSLFGKLDPLVKFFSDFVPHPHICKILIMPLHSKWSSWGLWEICGWYEGLGMLEQKHRVILSFWGHNSETFPKWGLQELNWALNGGLVDYERGLKWGGGLTATHTCTSFLGQPNSLC